LLPSLRNGEDKFITLGYLAQAQCDCGRYESMLAYSEEQIRLAESLGQAAMTSEAYLSVARACERTSQFARALDCCQRSLELCSANGDNATSSSNKVISPNAPLCSFQANLANHVDLQISSIVK